MKFTKQSKKEMSKKMAEEIESAGEVFFTTFQGLKFKDIEGLRRKLESAKGKFRVVRNTITSHALKNAGIDGWNSEDFIKGPMAMVILKGGDLVAAAKVLVDFGKTNQALKIKGGVTAKNWLSGEDCKRMSMIGSRQELLARLAGTLYSSVAQIAGVLNAPMRDLVLVISAVEEKKKKEGPAK